ncbi:MAG: carbon-nitrogen hydrolase family protein [Acidobacteriota bacterium]
MGVVLGTERVVDGALLAGAIVIHGDGRRIGFQDKVQLDPSEDTIYSPGSGRRVFQIGPLTFGVVICHEGWRYPETVRWAVRHTWCSILISTKLNPAVICLRASPSRQTHSMRKAALCRAAKNTCYFATVNFAGIGPPTPSATVRPDGTLLSYQPYGRPGLLVADIDLAAATGLLAARCTSI